MSCKIGLIYIAANWIKIWWITRPRLAIRQKLAASENICAWDYEKSELFASTSSWIPIFWTITSRVESSQTICIFSHLWVLVICKFLLPFSSKSKNSTFILKNSANNSIFASIFDSILDLRSSNSTMILQFSNSALTRLRLHSFHFRLDNEPRVGTPLCRYLK